MYVIVAGAGLVGGELSRKLAEAKHDVVVIDERREICDQLYSESGVVAIHGSCAQIGILNEAGIEKADTVVAATGSDADNLVCAMLAKSLGVSRIIVRMRNPAYESAYRLAGVTAIVRVTDLMVNQMIMEIEQPAVRRLMTIGSGRADIYMIIIPEGAEAAGKTVATIAGAPDFPSQCVFIAVYNHGKEDFAIPRGEQVICEGDEVFLISTAEDIKQAVEFLTVS